MNQLMGSTISRLWPPAEGRPLGRRPVGAADIVERIGHHQHGGTRKRCASLLSSRPDAWDDGRDSFPERVPIV